METTTGRRRKAAHPMSYVKPTMAPSPMKRYTMDEINAMLDEAEADFTAGKGIPHEEVMREWDKELEREEQPSVRLTRSSRGEPKRIAASL